MLNKAKKKNDTCDTYETLQVSWSVMSKHTAVKARSIVKVRTPHLVTAMITSQLVSKKLVITCAYILTRFCNKEISIHPNRNEQRAGHLTHSLDYLSVRNMNLSNTKLIV